MPRDTFSAALNRQLPCPLRRGWEWFSICLGVTLLLSPATQSLARAEGKVDFAHQVVPILKQHCAECHGDQEAEGGFSLNTRELFLDAGYATPGVPSDSYLLELIKSDDPQLQMPPASKPRVSAEQIAVLERWIAEGVAWEEGFTFAQNTYEPPLRPRAVDLPPPREGRTNPIDRVVDHYLRERGLELPATVDDRTFFRRLSLDLLGVLPAADELEEFVADGASDKREQLVDRLLARDHDYAVHWMAMWNDLLRNDYIGTGFIDGGRKQISQWLYHSLRDNKPYDQFVRELIAPTEESEGFIRGIKWRGSVNASQEQEIQFAQNVSQVFLGINLKCASCHNSFIDRWTLEETYALAAIYSERELEIHRCDKPTGRMAEAAWLFPELGTVDITLGRDDRLQQLARLMTHPENGRFTRTIANRLWRQLMGRGVVHPVDAMQTKPWNEDLLEVLAHQLVESDYDMKRLVRTIVTSKAYQGASVVEPEELAIDKYVYSGPISRRMTAEQFTDAVWQLTGSYPKEPHQVPAQFLRNVPESKNLQVRATLLPSDLLQRSLGRPNREQVVTSRPGLLTMLQALDLTNNQELSQTLADEAAQTLARSEELAPGDLIVDLFVRALSRPPTSEEMDVLMKLVGDEPTQQGFEDLLWAVVMLPEFQTIR